MRVPASAIGLCYPVEGIERFVSRLGVTLAKRILVGAEEFNAEEMLSHGIVSRLAPATELLQEAEILLLPWPSVRRSRVAAMLTIIRQAERGAIDAVAARELAAACSESEDLKEGLAAQKERRGSGFLGYLDADLHPDKVCRLIATFRAQRQDVTRQFFTCRRTLPLTG